MNYLQSIVLKSGIYFVSQIMKHVEFLRQKIKDWRTYPRLTDDQLRGISCPTLFIAGEYDQFAPEEELKRVTRLIPNSRYV